LALLAGQRLGDPVDPGRDEVGSLMDDAGALVGMGCGPAGKRLLRRRDGDIDIAGRGQRTRADRLAGRGIAYLDAGAALGRPPFAIDEEVAAHLQVTARREAATAPRSSDRSAGSPPPCLPYSG